MAITPDALERANRRGKATQAEYAALAARFDEESGRVVVSLHSDMEFTFPPTAIQGLEQARPAELKDLRLTPSGLGIYFPKLDVDISIPGLLHGVTGSTNWMASRLGSAGGSVSSVRKAQSARANGKLGGRPKGV